MEVNYKLFMVKIFFKVKGYIKSRLNVLRRYQVPRREKGLEIGINTIPFIVVDYTLKGGGSGFSSRKFK